MEKIAYFSGSAAVYWNSILLTLAASAAICMFLAFYLGSKGKPAAGFAAVPLSLGLGILLSRLCHWYFRADGYESFYAAMTDLSKGSFALMGVFLGCFLAAGLTRLAGLHRNLPKMLDCMSIAGAAGIATGRLASFFNASGRGQVIPGLEELPFVYPVTNVVSGAVEYRLATFLFQALAALAIFGGLALHYTREDKKARGRDGDTCLIFLLCYCASQVVMDSTRHDSLFFRSNGFVSVVQVLSACALALVTVVFAVRLVKARGFRGWYPGLWLGIAAGMGGAGYMEYYVQRHGDEAAFAYKWMILCLAAVVVLNLISHRMGLEKKEKAGNL